MFNTTGDSSLWKTSKWLARGGALLILLGFVLPSLTVSCSMIGVGGSMSLMQLANYGNQPILYLVLIAAVVVIILSLLSSNNSAQEKQFVLAQIIALVVGIVSFIITAIILSSQTGETYGMIEVNPQFGLFVLIAGFILAFVGCVMQWQDLKLPSSAYEGRQPPPIYEQMEPPLPQPGLTNAYLEVISGNLPVTAIPIHGDPFTIGRSSSSMLQLPNSKVSRHHAQIRFGREMWFIQDQGSAAGLLVNGTPTIARRIQNGDQITILDTIFIFHEN